MGKRPLFIINKQWDLRVLVVKIKNTFGDVFGTALCLMANCYMMEVDVQVVKSIQDHVSVIGMAN